MTSSNDRDAQGVPFQSTASPEELEELDRFDCGLLTPEERGRFLAKLYADGEKRRSLSEMFDLELLDRPEADEFQDAPTASNDVRARGDDLRPRWSENPRVLRALLTLSTSICVVCVLYLRRPDAEPVKVGRLQTPEVAPSEPAPKAPDDASDRLLATNEAVDVELEENAPVGDFVAALKADDEDEIATLSPPVQENAVAQSQDGASAANKKADPARPRGSFSLAPRAPSRVPVRPAPPAPRRGGGNAMNGAMGGGMGGGKGGWKSAPSSPDEGASLKREARAKAPTLDLAEIVAEKERRNSIATPERSEIDALATIDGLLSVGEFREAREEWDRLPQSVKDGLAGKTREGILLYFEENLEASERAFREALEMAPDDPVAARNLDFIRASIEKPTESDD